MKTFRNIFFLVLGFTFSVVKAQYYQTNHPFDEIPAYTSAYSSASTTEPNYYDNRIIGRWITDDGSQCINISHTDQGMFVIAVYNNNRYLGKFEYSYTRYAPCATTLNGHYLLDWNAGIDGNGRKLNNSYVTFLYGFEDDDHFFLRSVKSNVLLCPAMNTEDYRQCLANTQNSLGPAIHFRRYGATAASSASSVFLETLVKIMLSSGGSGSNSTSSSTYTPEDKGYQQDNYREGKSIFPVGLDKDGNSVYDYNSREIKYHTDGSETW